MSSDEDSAEMLKTIRDIDEEGTIHVVD